MEGKVDVDSGLLYIGDPCYVLSKSQYKIINKLLEKQPVTELKHRETAKPGFGVVINGFGGDGSYTITTKRNRDGLVTKAIIHFNH